MHFITVHTKHFLSLISLDLLIPTTYSYLHVHQVQKQVDMDIMELFWAMLLLKYPEVEPYLKQQLGGPRLKKWTAAHQIQHFTAAMLSTQRTESLNMHCKCFLNWQSSLNKVFNELWERSKEEAITRWDHPLICTIAI